MQSEGLDDDVKERLELLAKELIRLNIQISGNPENEWSLSAMDEKF